MNYFVLTSSCFVFLVSLIDQFVFNFGVIVDQDCLLKSDTNSTNCLLCNSVYFYDLGNLSCTRRNPNFNSRKILITNSDSLIESQLPGGLFNTIYRNFTQALLFESENSLTYVYSEIFFFLLGEDYHILQLTSLINVTLFENINATVTIQPWFCSFSQSIQPTGCLGNFQKAKVVLATKSLVFFVGNSLKISNISLFTNISDSNESCYSNLFCAIKGASPFLGLISMFPLLRDAYKLPVLEIVDTNLLNWNLTNFDGRWNFLIAMNSEFGGIIMLKNIKIQSFSLDKGILYINNDFMPLSDQAITLEALKALNFSLGNLYLNSSVSIINLIFTEGYESIKLEGKTMFFIAQFSGELSIKGCEITNILTSSQNLKVFELINSYLKNSIADLTVSHSCITQVFSIFSTNVKMENVTYVDLNESSIFQVENSALLIKNLSLSSVFGQSSLSFYQSVLLLELFDCQLTNTTQQLLNFNYTTLVLKNASFKNIFCINGANGLVNFIDCNISIDNILVTESIGGVYFMLLVSSKSDSFVTFLSNITVYNAKFGKYFFFWSKAEEFDSMFILYNYSLINSTLYAAYDLQPKTLIMQLLKIENVVMDLYIVSLNLFRTVSIKDLSIRNFTVSRYYAILLGICIKNCVASLLQINLINATIKYNFIYFEGPDTLFYNISIRNLIILYKSFPVVDCINRNYFNVSHFQVLNIPNAMTLFWVEDGYRLYISSVTMKCEDPVFCLCGLMKQDKSTGFTLLENIYLYKINTLDTPSLIYSTGCTICEISLINFTVSGIKSASKGVLYIQTFNTIIFLNSSFEDISSEDSSVLKALDSPSLQISGVLIKNVNSKKYGSFFISDLDNVMIDNLTILGVSGTEGGAAYLVRINYLELFKSYFSNISCKGGGAILFSSFSNLYISQCVFEKVSSQQQGGVIYLSRGDLRVNDVEAREGNALSGGFLFIREAYYIELSKLVISNFTVLNEGAALFIFQVDFMELNEITISKNTALGNSGNIYLCGLNTQNEIIIMNITCEKNNIAHGSCILSESNYKIGILGLVSTNNEGIILKFKSEFFSQIFLFDCNFKDNFKGSQEAIYAERVNLIFAGEIILKNLTANHFLFYFLRAQVNMSNVTVTYNLKEPANQLFKVIYGTECNFTASRLYLGNSNSSRMKFTALSFIGGVSELVNCTFEKLVCETSVACLLFQNVNVSIKQTNFIENTGLKGGGIYLLSSSLVLLEVKFVNCKSLTVIDKFSEFDNPKYPVGAELIFIGDGNNRSIFINSTKVITNFSKPLSFFLKRLFTLSITNSDFFSNNNNQGGLMINDCNQIQIEKTNFSGFNTSYGAVFKLVNQGNLVSTLKIVDSNFINNSARLGAVGYIMGNLLLNIQGAKFLSNEAFASDYTQGGIAGVIYFYSEDPEACALNIIDSHFLSNRAYFFAPTILSFVPMKTDNNHLSLSNSDGINFTESCSSFPIKVFLSLKKQTIEITNSTLANETTFAFGSGEILYLTISLTDTFERVLKFDNQTRISVTSDKGYIMRGTSQAAEGVIQFRDLEIKAKPNSSISIEFLVDFSPNLPIFLDGDSYRSSLTYVANFYSRPCQIGEIFVAADQTCRKCPLDFYSLRDPMIDVDTILVCLPCPENAACLGGSTIYPKGGYWRYSNMTDIIIECKSASSCAGGLDSNGTIFDDRGKCVEHHLGNMCYRCEIGYARLYARGLCEPCKSNIFLFIKLAITAILLILFIILQVRLTYHGRTRNSYGILTKQLLNHFQQVSLISLTDLAWTQDFKNMFKYQDYLAFLAQEFINLDCFIQDIGSNLLMNKIVATVVIPLFFSFIAFTFWILLFLWQRFFRGKVMSMHSLVNRTLLCSLIIIYLLFPELIRMCLSLLDCVRVSEEPRVSLLTFSPDIKCWNSEHLSYIYLAGMPGLIFWGLLTPFVILLLLVKNKLKIKEIIIRERAMSIVTNTSSKSTITITPVTVQITSKQNSSSSNTLSKNNKKQSKMKYGSNLDFLPTIEEKPQINELDDGNHNNQSSSGLWLNETNVQTPQGQTEELSTGALLRFLYKGYRREYYYWEIVIIFKKFALLFIANFSDLFPENSKAMILLITLTLFILVQKKYQPFDGRVFNNIEFISLIIAFLTANFGIMLFSEDLKNISQVFLTLIILLNFLFVLLWAWAMYRQYRTTRKRSPKKNHIE